MRFTLNLRAVLFPADDLPGQWVSWNPETGAVSQGDNPLDAWRMIMDAATEIARDMLNPDWTDDTYTKRHRILHPYRNGHHFIGTEPDESGYYLQEYREHWIRLSFMCEEVVDFVKEPTVVHSRIEVSTGCGVIFFGIPEVGDVWERPRSLGAAPVFP